MYGCTDVEVYFNPRITSKSSGQLETIIRNTISSYNVNELDDFNVTLRLSKLSTLIDESDDSIQSNSINVCPYIVYSPDLNISQSPSFRFAAELIKPYPFKDSNGFEDYKPSVVSSTFTYNGVEAYFQDDGLGNIQIVTSDIVNPQIIKPIAGSVNYKTGEINLVGFITSGYVGAGIKIQVVTKKDDIKAPSGRIFVIDDNDVTIKLIEAK